MASETGRGGKKRYNSQPMEGANKDSRCDDDLSWSTVVQGKTNNPPPISTSNSFNLLTTSMSYPDRSMRSGSVTSRGSGRSRGNRTNATPRHEQQSQRQDRQQQLQQDSRQNRPLDLGDRTRFVTPEQTGPFRDEIVVECQKINDQPFKGTITFTEATESIFMAIMGFNYNDLYSVRFRFSGCPTIRFKLKEQTNIDDLHSVEHFVLERKSQRPNEMDHISCKIQGIRGTKSVPHYDGSENDVRWIKIEGCEYQLTEDDISQGLEPFGQLLTPIREDIYENSDSERDIVGNGTNSVKMKLERPIPQFLPMHGRRIRIYYNGIEKLCSNCYGKHTRRQCRNQKTEWIEYVRDFMYKYKEIGEDYYGKWWDIVDTEYPGYFDEPSTAEEEHSPRSSEGQTESTNTHVAPPSQSRDPRVNKQLHQHAPTHQQRPEPKTNTQTQRTSYDRQTEMTRLLGSGLTLTQAKRYLDNKDEQAEIERLIQSSTTDQIGRNDTTTSTANNYVRSTRGRGLNQQTNK